MTHTHTELPPAPSSTVTPGDMSKPTHHTAAQRCAGDTGTHEAQHALRAHAAAPHDAPYNKTGVPPAQTRRGAYATQPRRACLLPEACRKLQPLHSCGGNNSRTISQLTSSKHLLPKALAAPQGTADAAPAGLVQCIHHPSMLCCCRCSAAQRCTHSLCKAYNRLRAQLLCLQPLTPSDPCLPAALLRHTARLHRAGQPASQLTSCQPSCSLQLLVYCL